MRNRCVAALLLCGLAVLGPLAACGEPSKKVGAPRTVGGSASGLSGSFCEKLRQLEATGSDVVGSVGTDASGDQVAQIKRVISQLRSVTDSLNEEPPAEIAGDVQYVADAFADADDQAQGADGLVGVISAAQVLFPGSDPEYERHRERLTAYASKECALGSGS